MKFARALFLILLCGSLPFCAQAQKRQRKQRKQPNFPKVGLEPFRLRPRAGEIALEGRVIAIGQGQITLEVFAFTNPNGKRGALEKPKNKTVALSAPQSLTLGEIVTAIGVDGGAKLSARAIVRASANEQTAPVNASATVGAPGKTTETQIVAATSLDALLPPPFVAGDLTIRPVQAGFDYSQRIFPGAPTLDLAPIFTFSFEISGAGATTKPPATLGDRLVLRRIIGPQNQYVAPFSLNARAIPVEGQPNRFGFYNALVDPNWEWADVDLDVIGAPSKKLGGSLKLQAVKLPAPGAELAFNREFVGDLGTRFTLLKIVRKESGEVVAIVRHRKPAAPADLELGGYQYKFKGDKTSGSGGGGLSKSSAKEGQQELSLTRSKTLTSMSSLEISISETARSLEDRAKTQRQRLRFPLRELRALQPIAPIALRSAPSVQGRAQSGEIAVIAESEGLDSGDDYNQLLLWTKAPPAQARRGVRWSVAGGSASFSDGAPDATLNIGSNDSDGGIKHLWHSDRTPIGPDETLSTVGVRNATKAPTFDLKLELEGRTLFDSWFTREVKIPRDSQLQTPADAGEQSLILRKVQRFSKPDDLPNYPQWIRGSWPSAGLVLVFEVNPLLVNAQTTVRALEAEDDAGRALKLGTLIRNSIYNLDMTRADGQMGQSKFYSLVVGQPAPDARTVKLWLRVGESSRSVDRASVELKNLPFLRWPN